MRSTKLFHDQKIAAGEHVRIWQGEDGSLFEHVFPNGRSITIRCQSLDEARSLMALHIPGQTELGCDRKLSQLLHKGEEHEAL